MRYGGFCSYGDYSGGRKPGEVSHSVMCEPVLAPAPLGVPF